MIPPTRPLSLSPKKNQRSSLPPDTSDGSFASAPYGASPSQEDLLPAARKLPSAFARTLSEIPSYEKAKSLNKVADCHLKIVVVGDGAVGKTCLLISYTQGRFPTEYVPTIFENYVSKVQGPRNKVIELALWDTAGQEEYNRLRPLSYTDVDILMVCYSVDSKTSFYNVQELWFPEVKHFCPDAPVMLVGLKSDLYALDNLEQLVDPKDADTLAQQLGAFAHVQCSAKSRDNVDEVFNLAMTTALYDELYGARDSSIFRKSIFKPKKPNEAGFQSSTSRRRRHRCVVL